MTEDVKDLAMRAALAVDNLVGGPPWEAEELQGIAATIQRVIEPALVAARERADLADKDALAELRLRKEAEAREAALRAELEKEREARLEHQLARHAACLERDTLQAEREEVNARLQSQAKVLGLIAEGTCARPRVRVDTDCNDLELPFSKRCYPCMARAAREKGE